MPATDQCQADPLRGGVDVREALDSVLYEWRIVRRSTPTSLSNGQRALLVVSMLAIFGCAFLIGRATRHGSSPAASYAPASLVGTAAPSIPAELSGDSPIANVVPVVAAVKPHPAPAARRAASTAAATQAQAAATAAPTQAAAPVAQTPEATPEPTKPAPAPAPAHVPAPVSAPAPAVARAPAAAKAPAGSGSKAPAGGSFETSE